MRVLVVHNKYSARMPSGENISVQSEVDWLRQAGVDVQLHEASNDDLLHGSLRTKFATGAETVWSRSAARAFAELLARVQPDLVHVHNLFPMLSASVPWAAHRRGLPVVWTVRNRRVTCVKGGHFRDDAPCYACRPGWRVPGVWFGCYNNSTTASALVTSATSVFRSIARRHVVAIAISDYIGRWLVDVAAFPADRVHVKYNGITPPRPTATIPPASANRTLLFTGKLVEHKGVGLLLDAWRRVPQLDAELRFVGDGPMAAEVAAAAADDRRIRWVGLVDPAELPRHMAETRALVAPSTWEEPFGRSAAEALAYGRPVITTGLGGLSEIVDERCGWITGTDADELARAISATTSDAATAQRAKEASERHRQLFSPESTTRTLVDIYSTALGQSHHDRP